jgi:Leucine-rich repeat (LRR) protein
MNSPEGDARVERDLESQVQKLDRLLENQKTVLHDFSVSPARPRQKDEDDDLADELEDLARSEVLLRRALDNVEYSKKPAGLRPVGYLAHAKTQSGTGSEDYISSAEEESDSSIYLTSRDDDDKLLLLFSDSRSEPANLQLEVLATEPTDLGLDDTLFNCSSSSSSASDVTPSAFVRSPLGYRMLGIVPDCRTGNGSPPRTPPLHVRSDLATSTPARRRSPSPRSLFPARGGEPFPTKKRISLTSMLMQATLSSRVASPDQQPSMPPRTPGESPDKDPTPKKKGGRGFDPQAELLRQPRLDESSPERSRFRMVGSVAERSGGFPIFNGKGSFPGMLGHNRSPSFGDTAPAKRNPVYLGDNVGVGSSSAREETESYSELDYNGYMEPIRTSAAPSEPSSRSTSFVSSTGGQSYTTALAFFSNSTVGTLGSRSDSLVSSAGHSFATACQEEPDFSSSNDKNKIPVTESMKIVDEVPNSLLNSSVEEGESPIPLVKSSVEDTESPAPCLNSSVEEAESPIPLWKSNVGEAVACVPKAEFSNEVKLAASTDVSVGSSGVLVSRKLSRRCWGFIFAIVLIGIGAIVGMVGALTARDRGSAASVAVLDSSTPRPRPSSPTSSPTPELSNGPSSRPSIAFSTKPSSIGSSLTSSVDLPNQELFTFLVSISLDSGQALSNRSSPQFLAYSWLAGGVDLPGYAPEKIIQRYALSTFYYSTSGDDWYENDLWLSSEDECLWFQRRSRSVCSMGKIKRLEIYYNDLDGSIPPELALLSDSLESLDLRGGPEKRLFGPLPSELGLLYQLQELYLPDNALTGGIPDELFLRNIEKIDLSGNALNGTLPEGLFTLQSLNSLELGGNLFSGELPQGIGNLTMLSSLRLDRNVFTGQLPTSIGNLNALDTLNIADNRLTAIPFDLSMSTLLTFLSLSNNNITGTLFPGIGQLTSLRSLYLAKNDLVGAIPTELGMLVNLNTLDLSRNGFSGTIPTEICFIGSSLRVLKLNHNLLWGSVPTEFVHLDKLDTLFLNTNSLAGSMPSPVCTVFERTIPTVFIDCDRLDCPCCNFCCGDEEEDCMCRYTNTTEEWRCF